MDVLLQVSVSIFVSVSVCVCVCVRLFVLDEPLRAQLAQLQTTLSQQMNKTHIPTQTTRSSLPTKIHSKKASLHHSKKHPQAIPQQPHRHTY